MGPETRERYGPEVRLLLAAARGGDGEEGAALCRRTVGAVSDWEQLLTAAFRHGLGQLLTKLLEGAAWDMVPEPVAERLRRTYQQCLARNYRLTAELLDLMTLFGQAGILAVPFKGPLFGADLYGDPGMRPFGDLDVYLGRKHLPEAARLLEERRYRLAFDLDHIIACAPLVPGWFFPREVAFVRQKDGLSVEIHLSALSDDFSPAGRDEELTGSLIPVSLLGQTVRTFPRDELLLYGCLHGSKHLWDRLLWVSDVARLIGLCRRSDWDAIMKRATSLGARRILYLGLQLAGEILSAEPPEDLMSELAKDRSSVVLCARFREALFSGSVFTSEPDYLGRLLLYLRMWQGWGHRIGLCVSAAIVPREVDLEFIKLRGPLIILYLFVRPLRLLVKYTLGRLFSRFGAAGNP